MMRIESSIIMLFFILFTAGASATTYYVDSTIVTSGSGLSWPQAKKTLQEALDLVLSGDSVLVAKGSYFPTKDPNGNASPADAKDKTFYIEDGVSVYGGYPNGGGTRDVEVHETILNGKISTFKVYHVVIMQTPRSTAVGICLDGFTITNGFANGSGNFFMSGVYISQSRGGAIYQDGGKCKISNNQFKGNFAGEGGGIWMNSSEEDTISHNLFLQNAVSIQGGAISIVSSGNSIPNFIQYNTFTINTSNGHGGAILIYNGKNTISANSMTSNYASNRGGAIKINNGINTIVNNLFHVNSAGIYGGSILTDGGSNTLTNNTLVENFSDLGGGLTTESGTNNFYNNIFWLNKLGANAHVAGADFYSLGGNNLFRGNLLQLSFAEYSNSSGGINYLGASQSNNLFAQNPDFVGIVDFHLQAGSPAINTGMDLFAPATDIEGKHRPIGSSSDMGAYEFGREVLYVDPTAMRNHDGSSWEDAFNSLDSALQVAATLVKPAEIYVAQGVYKPTQYPQGCVNCMTDRDFTFFVPDGIYLFGGYASEGTDRDFHLYETILIGDIDTMGNNDAYHVLLSAGYR